MSVYLKIIKFNIKGANAYIHEVFAKFIQQVIPLGFNVILWSIVIVSNPTSDRSINDLISYYITAAGLGLLLFVRYGRFGTSLKKVILEGRLNNYLTKPVNELWYIYSETIGKYYAMFATSILFVAIGIFLQSSNFTFWMPIFFIWNLTNAYFLNIAMNILDSGISSLLTTESNGIRSTINHITSFLAGFTVPLFFFPEKIQFILQLTPFPHMLFNTINSLQTEGFDNQLFFTSLIGSLWAFGFFLTVIYLWKYLLKRYEGVGI